MVNDRSMDGAWVGTDLPGPRSRALLSEQDSVESSARAYPRGTPLALSGGSGSYIWDVDGNRFLDFLTGAGVLSLGHNHPGLQAAAMQQVLDQTHALDFPTPSKAEFSRRLISTLPLPLRDNVKIQFCSPTGADAVDAALKLCKTSTKRGGIIAFHGAYHGSTHSTMAITGLRASKEPLSNLMPGVSFFPFSDCAHCPLSLNKTTCQINCIAYLENMLDDPNGGVPLPACFILELVQGEGGVNVADREFVQRLAALAQRTQTPLVVDEVQTGGGRTGTFFAFEQYGIEPDVVVASKAIGGGHPVAVIIYKRELDTWAPGAHTGTFRGNQVAFAAGSTYIQVVSQPGFLEQVGSIGERLRNGLIRIADSHPDVLMTPRGLGLMVGVEVRNYRNAPSDVVAETLRVAALRGGLLYESAGRAGCVARFLPPLNLSVREVDEALEIFRYSVEGLSLNLG